MRRSPDWFSLYAESWKLGFDASMVIGLRLAKLSACDGAAAIEAQRMIGEKIDALLRLHLLAVTGGLGTSWSSAARKSVRHYGTAVRANRRRLARRR